MYDRMSRTCEKKDSDVISHLWDLRAQKKVFLLSFRGERIGVDVLKSCNFRLSDGVTRLVEQTHMITEKIWFEKEKKSIEAPTRGF